LEAYGWLLFFHILAAIVWVDGGITINIISTRAIRSGDPARQAAIAMDGEWIGSRVIAPTSAIILALGLAMVGVSEAWTIGQLWIALALVLFGLTALTGAIFLGPESGRIGKLIRARGAEEAEVRRRIRRIVLIARLDLITLIVIVWDMAVKPGL
jgi:uncharacterized membrane protein